MDFFVDDQEIEDRGYAQCRNCGALCDGDVCSIACEQTLEFEKFQPDDEADEADPVAASPREAGE